MPAVPRTVPWSTVPLPTDPPDDLTDPSDVPNSRPASLAPGRDLPSRPPDPGPEPSVPAAAPADPTAARPADLGHQRALATVRALRNASAGGVVVGADVKGLRWCEPEQAVMVLGPPRSGKTSGVIVPSIVAAPGAVVATSTKPDVASATAAIRRGLGPCLLYDPSGTVPPVPGTEPLRWSPVHACRSWDEAVLLAAEMVETAGRLRGAGGRLEAASHWTERATALLAPLLHAAALLEAPMAEVLHWVDTRQPDPALAALSDAAADVALDGLSGVLATEQREQSGIWSTAAGSLAAYRSTAALRSTEGPAFDPRAFLDAGGTLYVVAAGSRQRTLAPLVVGLLGQIRQAVYDRAAAWALARPDADQRPPTVLFALDELANIAPLPDLPAMVSEAGGQGLTVLACLQDLSQARARWGLAAEGFPSLFGYTLVLPGIGDVATLRALSALAGDHEERRVSLSHPLPAPTTGARALARRLLLGPDPAGRPRPTRTLAPVHRPRLPVDVLARGQPGHAVLVDPRNRLTTVRLTPWFAAEPWRSLLDPRSPGLPRRPEPGADPDPRPEAQRVAPWPEAQSRPATPHRAVAPDPGHPFEP